MLVPVLVYYDGSFSYLVSWKMDGTWKLTQLTCFEAAQLALCASSFQHHTKLLLGSKQLIWGWNTNHPETSKNWVVMHIPTKTGYFLDVNSQGYKGP